MSDNEPVAWVVFADDGSDAVTTCLNRDVAGVIAEAHGWQVAPLYRKPMLTHAEREAIEYGIAECEMTAALCSERPVIASACKALAALRGLLERTK